MFLVHFRARKKKIGDIRTTIDTVKQLNDKSNNSMEVGQGKEDVIDVVTLQGITMNTFKSRDKEVKCGRRLQPFDQTSTNNVSLCIIVQVNVYPFSVLVVIDS